MHLERETLADTVYKRMRTAILKGDLEDGTELNQVALARQFNVSRVPVREALRRLQAELIVTATPYQQYVVRQVNPDKVEELIAIRAELEVLAIRRHMRTPPTETLIHLRHKNKLLRAERDTEEWLRGDLELHELLDGPGTEVARMVRDLRERVHRYLTTVASTHARQRQACFEHDTIIDAMAAGDGDAAEAALRNHVSHTQSLILSHVRKAAPAPVAVTTGDDH